MDSLLNFGPFFERLYLEDLVCISYYQQETEEIPLILG